MVGLLSNCSIELSGDDQNITVIADCSASYDIDISSDDEDNNEDLNGYTSRLVVTSLDGSLTLIDTGPNTSPQEITINQETWQINVQLDRSTVNAVPVGTYNYWQDLVDADGERTIILSGLFIVKKV